MKKAAADRPNFAPIPLRAMSDEELSSLDIRVLMVIAAHDRMGKNSIGCYASHTRLAAIVRCHLKSLSRSLRTLAEKGYISGELHPLNRKTRIYKVLYTEADGLSMKPLQDVIGSKTVTIDSDLGNETATDRGSKGNSVAPNRGAIGNRVEENKLKNQCVAPSNIFSETDNKSSETHLIDSAEAASSLQEDAQMTTGSFLAIVERAIQKRKIDKQQMIDALVLLEKVMDTEEFGTVNYGRAYRLHEQIGFMLEDVDTAD